MNDYTIDNDMKRVLIREALSKLPNSFAPYSHYNVAAAVLTASGKIYTGVNVESSLLSCTICAERNAIFSAVAEGDRRITAIAIVGGLNAADTEDLEEHDYCTPCGVCRQVMRDFCGDPKTFPIICAKSAYDYKEFTLDQLLPESFGPEDLDE
ncbi:MAG: cytidine deaminase [Mogibacterium sp.]|nr:cytidine deaminase [Mogibacterium sp.]MBR2541223.1 cytidine deaminase [Mogibacterium sp.]